MTFRTQSLLDIGYVAAQLREDIECLCEPVPYRARVTSFAIACPAC